MSALCGALTTRPERRCGALTTRPTSPPAALKYDFVTMSAHCRGSHHDPRGNTGSRNRVPISARSLTTRPHGFWGIAAGCSRGGMLHIHTPLRGDVLRVVVQVYLQPRYREQLAYNRGH